MSPQVYKLHTSSLLHFISNFLADVYLDLERSWTTLNRQSKLKTLKWPWNSLSLKIIGNVAIQEMSDFFFVMQLVHFVCCNLSQTGLFTVPKWRLKVTQCSVGNIGLSLVIYVWYLVRFLIQSYGDFSYFTCILTSTLMTNRQHYTNSSTVHRTREHEKLGNFESPWMQFSM